MKKKRFLIITENIGKTAPGIVFERLIAEISLRNYIEVVCLKNDSGLILPRIHCQSAQDAWRGGALFTPRIKARVSKISLGLFGDDFGAQINAKILHRTFKNKISSSTKFDYILSLVSYGHTSPLLLAEKLIEEKIAAKNIAYFVDAIPAPLGWSIDNYEFRGLKKFIVNRMRRLNALFSSNSKMLEYQLGLCESLRDLPSAVLLTPIDAAIKVFPPPVSNRHNFLYAGGVYGKRTIKHILKALKIVLKNNQDVYLVFVGSDIKEEDLAVLNPNERKHVLVEPFTRNLDPYYRDATALLDIDADMDNDVFLSSKVTNYLAVNRIILSETGSNSPASNLLSGVASIIQCPHDSKIIANAMISAIEQMGGVNFDDRNDLLISFSAQAVVDEMEKLLALEVV